MKKDKIFILTVILLSYFVTAMDGAVVITGLEKIAKELSLSQVSLSWVTNAYVLAWGGFMLLGGKLSDTLGRKQALNLSLVIFGISSALAGLASSADILIFARFLQGMSAAVLAPTSLALIIDYFEGQERVKAIAWYSSISGLGMSIGLIVGGALADFFSWRYGFFINIPIVCFMLMVSFMELDNKTHDAGTRSHLDITGTILSVVCIFSFVYAINGTEQLGFWMAVSALSLATFIGVEKHSQHPVMPLWLFNSTRTRANISRILFSGSMMGFYFFISQYLQEVFHLSPLWVGIAFFPLTLSTFVAAVVVPTFIHRFGNSHVLFSGLVIMLIGFGLIVYLGGESSYLIGISVPMLLLGIGQGFAMSPLTNAGIMGVTPNNAGVASGLVNAAHQIGCSIGLSLMVTASNGLSNAVSVCHTAMIVAFIFILIALFVMFGRAKYARKIVLTTINKKLWNI